MQSSVSSSERSVTNPERTSRLWTKHPSVRKGRFGHPGLAIGPRSYAREITNSEEFLQPTPRSATTPADRPDIPICAPFPAATAKVHRTTCTELDKQRDRRPPPAAPLWTEETPCFV